MIELKNETLGALPAAVDLPRYDRRAVTAGIAHIGVGNFHRAHQALYIDRCLHRAEQQMWGIVGITITDGASDVAKADVYRRQDGLYTLTEFDPDGGRSTRVIGAMIDYLHAPHERERVLEVLSSPELRIVTLTITEGGYNIDEFTGRFRLDEPAVARDLRGEPPITVFGYLVEALARRRAAGVPPFTIASCDNLRRNGDTTRTSVVAFADARDPALARWIEREVTFPNSMVDRITPGVPDHVRRRLTTESGIDDGMPAMSESFIQWVIEDRFCNGRPELDAVGVEIRDDVDLFEGAKGRLLNASHMMLAYPALLAGYRLVHDAMGDERLATHLRRFMTIDAIPLVEGPPGVSLERYAEIIRRRFANPSVADQLVRIASDGAAKLPVFHRKTLEMLLANGGPFEREAFFLACFARYLDGRDDNGATFEVIEPHFAPGDWERLRAEDGLGFLRCPPVAAIGLDRNADFVAAYRAAATSIASRGVLASLDP